MKYIVFEIKTGRVSIEMPIIFPNNFVHSEVAKVMSKIDLLKNAEIVSAGEVSSTNIAGPFFGKSETLKVESRKGIDEDMVRMHDYFSGLK